MENVILVNENDQEMGIMEKMEAHKKGLLHRAISVFIFDINGRLLIQKRAITKYHSKGLWSNTACSHPLINETNLEAANRRLKQEMGMECKLQKAFDFIYNEPLDSNLIEHEFDHVYIGFTNDIPKPNPDEVSEWKYISHKELHEDIIANPFNYTVWFKKIYERVNEFSSVI